MVTPSACIACNAAEVPAPGMKCLSCAAADVATWKAGQWRGRKKASLPEPGRPLEEQ